MLQAISEAAVCILSELHAPRTRGSSIRRSLKGTRSLATTAPFSSCRVSATQHLMVGTGARNCAQDCARADLSLSTPTVGVDTEPKQGCVECSVVVNLQIELAIVAVSFSEYRQSGRSHEQTEPRFSRDGGQECKR